MLLLEKEEPPWWLQRASKVPIWQGQIPEILQPIVQDKKAVVHPRYSTPRPKYSTPR